MIVDVKKYKLLAQVIENRMTLYYSVAMNYSAKLRKSFELCNTLRHRFARRGATISFTYAIAWYDLCIYIQIIRYGVTVLQITVR